MRRDDERQDPTLRAAVETRAELRGARPV